MTKIHHLQNQRRFVELETSLHQLNAAIRAQEGCYRADPERLAELRARRDRWMAERRALMDG